MFREQLRQSDAAFAPVAREGPFETVNRLLTGDPARG